MLTPRDLQRLRETCLSVYEATTAMVPLMPRTTLLPHQKHSLVWMEERESTHRGALNDDWLWEDRGGHFVNVMTSQVCPTVPPSLKTRGGYLCDDPGTGKTATMLALCLKTRGLVPSPPPPRPAPPTPKRASPLRQSRLDEEARMALLPRVACTLIVVPPHLVSQWAEMVSTHAPALTFRQVATPGDWGGWDTDLILVSNSVVSAEASRLVAHGVALARDCALLSVRFLRLVVDEGHAVGNDSNLKWLLQQVSCERRWIVTGTPTKLTTLSASLSHIYHVLAFLQVHPTDQCWTRLITDPLRRDPASPRVQNRLARLLGQFLLKHSSSVVGKFPAVRRLETLLRFTEGEREAYNSFATVVKANARLIAIGEQGKKMSVRASRKATEEMNSNFRLALGVRQHDETFALELSAHNLMETRQLMDKEPPECRERVEAFIRNVTSSRATTCPSCRKQFVLQLVYGCGHTVCPFCFDSRLARVACEPCGRDWDANEFAWLQPGFELRFSLPSLTQSAAPTAKLGTKSRYLCERIAELQRDARQAGKPPFKCIVFSQFRQVVNYVGDALLRVLGEDAIAELWSKYRQLEVEKFKSNLVKEWRCKGVNKSVLGKRCGLYYTTVKLIAAPLQQQQREELAEVLSTTCEPDNARVGQSVWVAAKAQQGVVVKSSKKCSGVLLEPTLRPVECSTLLMAKDAAHGLNLPQVGHVFLLDPVHDSALEQQIIARAARLGNFNVVTVEYVLIQGSVEEEMYRAIQKGGGKQTTGADFLIERLAVVQV